MQNEYIRKFPSAKYLYLFIFLHLLGWSLIPALVRYNLPLDAIEGTTWGHQLEWGYDKNPFLNGWLTALATYLSAPSGWMVYLFSQLSVAICFWVVWQLGKQMLPSIFALVAVMSLEGIQYYNFHAIDFNDNTLELGLWALSIYFFYHALQKDRVLAWIATGASAGLGMMAKYYTASLLTAMVLFLFIYPENRKHLAKIGPYLGLITFIVIILPHTIWLFFHDFITVTYVFERASAKPHLLNHLFFPAQFTWQQLEAFFPALLLLSLLWIGKKPLFSSQPYPTTHFDKAFLFFLGLGPFLLTILLSFLLGIKLRAGWGMPLLTFWMLTLLVFFKPRLTKAKLYGFIVTIFIFMGLLLTGYAISLIDSGSTTSANFPGREIADTITNIWHKNYHSKLYYVAGSRWMGGNISFYSADHPAHFVEWDRRRAPWININDLEAKGGVFVWSISDKERMPDAIRTRFPQLSQTITMEFQWKRNKRHLSPIKIGIAYLPPKARSVARHYF